MVLRLVGLQPCGPSAATRCAVRPDCLEARVARNQLPDLVSNILPVANKSPGRVDAHDLNALLCEHRKNGFRVGALHGVLLESN